MAGLDYRLEGLDTLPQHMSLMPLKIKSEQLDMLFMPSDCKAS